MKNHTDILNFLIESFGLKSYLEIGVQNKRNNYDKVKAEKKYGVDPDHNSKPDFTGTSDEFFEFNNARANRQTFDLIFIDGLHHAEQVEKDFFNSLACLSENGFIVIHDCLPEKEEWTTVPRGDQKVWTGDVYKFVMNLHKIHGVGFLTVNVDFGCCVIWGISLITTWRKDQWPEITWSNYQSQSTMNIVNEQEFVDEIKPNRVLLCLSKAIKPVSE